MTYPFEIGEVYENNNGAYTVLEIDPPKMRIQYADRSEVTVNIEIQTRIWDRIQAERMIEQQEREKEARVRRPSIKFEGLSEDDFKDNVVGTSWRGREGLGGLVAQQLSDLTGQPFISDSIYRQPRFFVSRTGFADQNEGVKHPKFMVKLNFDELYYGLHIEKSDEYMGSEWRWPLFLNLLATEKWQKQLEATIAEYNLQWELQFEPPRDPEVEPLLSGSSFVTSFENDSQFKSFTAFYDHLQNLPAKQWCNLYLGCAIPKQEAIDMGVQISRPICQLFRALTPFYSTML